MPAVQLTQVSHRLHQGIYLSELLQLSSEFTDLKSFSPRNDLLALKVGFFLLDSPHFSHSEQFSG